MFLHVSLHCFPAGESGIGVNKRPSVHCSLAGVIKDWPALHRWKSCLWWDQRWGHRSIPVEVGVHGTPSWREEAMPFSAFLHRYMVPSLQADNLTGSSPLMQRWLDSSRQEQMPTVTDDPKGEESSVQPPSSQSAPVDSRKSEGQHLTSAGIGMCSTSLTSLSHGGQRGNATNAQHTSQESRCESQNETIAYLAQHSIFEHLPELQDDIREPKIWREGYEMRNIWMGTRGTVTPLHFDSMDNLFCQVAGAS